MNSSRTPKSVWSDSFGVAASRSAQTLLLIAAVVVAFIALRNLTTLIIPIILALIFACALNPMMRFLKEKARMSSLWATITTLLTLVVVGGGALALITKSIISQFPELLNKGKDGFYTVKTWLETSDLPFTITNEQIESAKNASIDFLTSSTFGSSALAGISTTGTIFTGLFLMLVILFFFLKDGNSIWEFILRPLHKEKYERAQRVGAKSVKILGNYVQGTSSVAAIDAVGIGIGLVILGVPLAIPLAALTFIFAFIPMVGALIAGILAALVALVSVGWVKALIVVGLIILVQQIEGNLLQPKIMGSSLSLHPLVILLALTSGTILAGIIGAVLAVPITAVIWGALTVWEGDNEPARFVKKKLDPVAPVIEEIEAHQDIETES